MTSVVRIFTDEEIAGDSRFGVVLGGAGYLAVANRTSTPVTVAEVARQAGLTACPWYGLVRASDGTVDPTQGAELKATLARAHARRPASVPRRAFDSFLPPLIPAISRFLLVKRADGAIVDGNAAREILRLPRWQMPTAAPGAFGPTVADIARSITAHDASATLHVALANAPEGGGVSLDHFIFERQSNVEALVTPGDVILFTAAEQNPRRMASLRQGAAPPGEWIGHRPDAASNTTGDATPQATAASGARRRRTQGSGASETVDWTQYAFATAPAEEGDVDSIGMVAVALAVDMVDGIPASIHDGALPDNVHEGLVAAGLSLEQGSLYTVAPPRHSAPSSSMVLRVSQRLVAMGLRRIVT